VIPSSSLPYPPRRRDSWQSLTPRGEPTLRLIDGLSHEHVFSLGHWQYGRSRLLDAPEQHFLLGLHNHLSLTCDPMTPLGWDLNRAPAVLLESVVEQPEPIRGRGAVVEKVLSRRLALDVPPHGRIELFEEGVEGQAGGSGLRRAASLAVIGRPVRLPCRSLSSATAALRLPYERSIPLSERRLSANRKEGTSMVSV